MRTDIEKNILDLCRKIQRLDDKNFNQMKPFLSVDLNHYSLKTGGWLPIHFAAHLGKENIFMLLIDNGANPILQVKNGWKNGFMLIGNEEMRGRMRQYCENKILERNKEIYDHNIQNTIAGCPYMLLSRIAESFIKDDWRSFSWFSRTTTIILYKLKPYIEGLKLINDKQKKIESNFFQIGLYQTYNPQHDMLIGQAEADYLQKDVYGNGGRHRMIKKKQDENERLEAEIPGDFETLSRRMVPDP